MKKAFLSVLIPVIAGLVFPVTANASHQAGDEIPSPEVLETQGPKAVGSFVYASAGYTRIISELSVSDGITIVSGNPKNGFNYGAGYEYVTAKGFGFGASALGYKFGCTERATTSSGTVTATDNNTITSIMGTFSYFQYTGRWRASSRLGAGAAMHKEVLMDVNSSGSAIEKSKGITLQVCVDILYQFTDTFSGGFTMSTTEYFFPTIDSNAIQGLIRTVDIGAALRIAF